VKSSPLSISTHNNLVLVFTNTHYKPSLCCLELIFAGSPIHPSVGAQLVSEQSSSLRDKLPEEMDPKGKGIIINDKEKETQH
jgi:hypothetical protein